MMRQYLRLVAIAVMMLIACSYTAGAEETIEPIVPGNLRDYIPLQIEIDSRDRKWIMARNALFIYSNGHLHHISETMDLPHVFHDMALGGNDHLWTATADGLLQWDGYSWHEYNQQNTPELPATEFTEVAIGQDGVRSASRKMVLVK